MSVGNIPIEIDLNKAKTTLISGQNGSGKTTVLSALCFALFGRAYGSLTKSGLVNSINLKQLLVTVEFTIGKKRYRVVRGIKPNVFEIYENGELKNQDPDVRDYQKVLEQQILKFNYRAFTQVVMVGGGDNYTPFMRLSTRDRREFVEDLLDIRVFSAMNLLVKDAVKDMKDRVKESDSTLRSLKERIVLQESFIKKLKSEKSNSVDKVLDTIRLIQENSESLQTELSVLMKQMGEYETSVNSQVELDGKMTEIRLNARQIQYSIDKKRQSLNSYGSLDNCPTCMQQVPEEHKLNVISGFENEISSLESNLERFTKAESILREKIESYADAVEKYAMVQRQITELNRQLYSNNITVQNANKQLDEMKNDTSNIEEEAQKLKTFATEYVAADKSRQEILTTQQYNDFIQQVLSDSGIKSKIIKQYVPTINKLINKYLTELDFFVSFHLDEQFNETIKSRHRDTFTYDNFSDGQKRRIDLAILLTWMEIAKAKNALHCNIAFFDEIDAPLDAAGSDMLHAALKTCSSENVFIISHKGDLLSDKVDDIITFRIHNNFTERVEN